jgi:hypothetical protein
MRRLTLLLLLSAIGALAPTAAQAATCLTSRTMPLTEVATDSSAPAGFEAHGLTVSRGKTIDTFPVTVLGVLKDGVGVGHDMIIVDVHNYAAMDDPRHGVHGIWAGMSGSPVYTNETTPRLIGSVSFGLSTGASTIGGVTPAQDLDSVLGQAMPAVAPSPGRASAALQKKMTATGAVNATQAESKFEQLPIPLAVSGLAASRLQTVVNRLPGNQRFIPFRAGGGGVAAEPGDVDDFNEIKEPGSNFATALSYGDVMAAGVGTTTEGCGDSVVAFGHPMNFDGPTSLSVHNADAILIQNDLIAPFKLANIGNLVGTLDQDRMTGIRALIGPQHPIPVNVHSTLSSDGGAADLGDTFVNRTKDTPDLAAAHLLGNVDSTIDRIGPGRMTLGWTVVGTAGGQPFSFTRNNKFADQSDISFAATDELFGMLATLVFNPFADITFSNVTMTADVRSDFRQYTVTGLEQFDGSTWVPIKDGDTVTVQPGVPLRVRVLLENYRSSAPVPPVEMTFPVADDASGDGSLDISAGSDSGSGDDGSSGSQPKSFSALLDQLGKTPQNNDLTGKLTMFGSNGPPPTTPQPTPAAPFDVTPSTPPTVTSHLAEVVGGSLSIPVTVGEPQESPGPDLNLKAKSSLRMGTALRKGIALTVRSSAPGRLVVRAYVDKKTARKLHIKNNAKGPVVVAALVKQIGDGRHHVTLKIAPKVKKHLRHAKRLKLALKATITDVDGNRTTDRSKLVLTRK